MNMADSERIAGILDSSGLTPASKTERADFVIVNMCSVRKSAVDRVYGIAEKYKKTKNKTKTILTGCILKKDKLKLTERFDLIIGIKDLPKLPKLLGLKNNPGKDYFKLLPKISDNSIALIPIMTGCNNFCSYCVVPYTREREKSRPVKDILSEAKNAVKSGCKEIWLLGQNVNSYKPIPFSALLGKINDIPGEFWIKFTSSHPKDFSDSLITAMKKCKKVADYLNLPVQSGNNDILKKMNRPYTVEKYKNLVKKIRSKIPDIALSTDIIVGFPGETKKQFENTAKLFREIKYDMAYINKYSLRPGTAAAKLKDNVSKEEKSRREKVLNEILKKTALEKNKKYMGKAVEVLVEKFQKPDLWLGKTKTHKTVRFESKKNNLKKFVKVKIIDATPWGLKGTLNNKP